MCDRYVVVWQLTEVASEHSDLGHRHSDVRVVWSVEKGRGGGQSPTPKASDSVQCCQLQRGTVCHASRVNAFYIGRKEEVVVLFLVYLVPFARLLSTLDMDLIEYPSSMLPAS